MALAPILRELARNGQHGWSRHPSTYYIFEGSYYRNAHHDAIRDQETHDRIARLSERYRRFYRTVNERAFDWRDDGNTIYWADNSIEQPQVCAKGCHRRMVSLKAPSGDLCY